MAGGVVSSFIDLFHSKKCRRGFAVHDTVDTGCSKVTPSLTDFKNRSFYQAFTQLAKIKLGKSYTTDK